MTEAHSGTGDHSHSVEDLPRIDHDAVTAFLQEEAASYVEAGEFYFRNPADLGTRVLINWFNEVSQSSPERRWGTLEMLALYGLSAAEATDGMPLSQEQKSGLIASVAVDGPLRDELEHAAGDVIALLQSGADPAAELPSEWALYRHCLPAVFASACMIFAVLTLETVREAAAQQGADPAAMWRGWLTSTSDS